MRRNPFFPLSPVSLRRSQAGCQESVWLVRSSLVRSPIPQDSPEFPPPAWYFLTGAPSWGRLLLVGEHG